MAVTTLTPAQALREPRHIDLRAIAGLVILVLGIAGSISYWSTTNDTREIVVAAHDMPAGTTLQASDLTVASVRVDDSIYRAAIPSSSLSTIVGKRLGTPVYTGQVVAQKQVSGPEALAAGQLAVSIPIAAADAATGILPLSDVQVLVTTDKGKPTSKTSVVLQRVRVADVVYDQAQAVINGGTGSTSQQRVSSLTLVVTPDQAVQLAQARFNGDLSVALLPPEAS
ncbi:MAG TPA: RcpC/CpaB family pilus assembly protein [Chloroflexota bacterium]|nr:RcpC/CpaB family pilus assembly protein [Chloroflexota bacterium]